MAGPSAAKAKQEEDAPKFTFSNQIWNVQSKGIRLYDGTSDVDPLESIRRGSMPKMYSVPFSEENLRNTLAQSEIRSPSENSESSNGTATTNVDLLGHSSKLYQRAHLIPEAPVGSKTYGFIAEAVLGMKGTDSDTRLKLVKGVQKGSKPKRIRQTGLKHNKYNKLRLFLRKEYFDNSPYLLIVPILSLKEVLGWDETDPKKDYSYDVMICAPPGVNSEEMYQQLFTKLGDDSPTCSPQDIQIATNLLSTFAEAMATSTFNDNIMESMSDSNATTVDVATVVGRINEARTSNTAAVDLPVVYPEILGMGDAATLAKNGIRVVKARVSKKTSLPDPYLLAVKAAANWFAGRNTPMLAAGSVEDFGSDSEDDTDGSNYNDDSTPLSAAHDDPLVCLRNSLQCGSHVQVEFFSCD